MIEPPTKDRARVGSGPIQGRIWVSEWNAGQLGLYDPKANGWREWKLPGERPRAYAVYVDDRDIVWVSDWGANAILSFDPATETFRSYPTSAGCGERAPDTRPPGRGLAAGIGAGPPDADPHRAGRALGFPGGNPILAGLLVRRSRGLSCRNRRQR